MRKIFAILFLAAGLFAAEMKLSGSVVSDDTKMISSRFMGFVKKIYVSEGDRVKKGDLLYIIDSKEIDLAKTQVELMISQAKLAVMMNENMYNNVLTNLERFRRLYKKGMVAKHELENMELAEKNTKAMVEISKKQVKQAQAKLKEVLHQYEYLKLRAPNDGVIIQKNIKAGQIAMPGMPALILTSLENLKILVEVGESSLKHIKIGDKVDVLIPSIGFQTTGKIAAVIPASNPMTHKFKVKISFDKGEKETVIPGMYAEVIIK
ncbi:efflux RND transporter periplasmic adaptor subunit [Nitrosophilus alvini]|uniref:efflux RND transporter periplasmic adaptor subunit n=1 Tax=Nitrosophilus alvini TaxID=2714855 RepID=UPI00190B9010|nr:efflux RND transporter periplasmic adaptor subunit [Nitrosophilus alvini]